MDAKATLLADQEADVVQSGAGYTGILGANISLLKDKLNIGIKYEFKTSILLENETSKDILVGFTPLGAKITQYPNGNKSHADLPAYLSVGASYKILDNFLAAAGIHYYFDEAVDWGNNKTIDKGYIELAFGSEYGITDDITASAGWLQAIPGVASNFQSDMNNALALGSIFAGGKWKAMKMVDVNLGFMYSMYTTYEKQLSTHLIGGTTPFPKAINENYDKKNMIVAIGFDFHF